MRRLKKIIKNERWSNLPFCCCWFSDCRENVGNYFRFVSAQVSYLGHRFFKRHGYFDERSRIGFWKRPTEWYLKSARSIIRKPLNEICSIHIWSEHIVVIAYKLTLLQGTLLNIHTSAFQTFPTLRPAWTRVCAPALCSVIQNCVLDPFQDYQAPS